MSVRPQDLATTLRRRYAEGRASAEARAREVLDLLEGEVARAQAEGLCGRAWLIGSLAWGTFGPESDVDLVVESCADAGVGPLWDRLVARLGVPVDLLRFEALPPSFQERVLSEGRPFHGA